MMFHPDRDTGDTEKMTRLNAARDEGDWDRVKRMYLKYIETDKEEKLQIC